MRRNLQFEQSVGINYLVLWRDTENSETDVCPFCLKRHKHGIGDGHRVSHCDIHSPKFLKELVIPEHGISVFQKDGYIVRTRTK